MFAFTVFALLPLVDKNGGDLDGFANAGTFVLLALGLNIVVGFAGLLDLGYAAFFALGAYAYGLAASFQLKIPWSVLWTPFVWLGQVSEVRFGPGEVAQLHFSYWVMLVIAALICAGFGILFGAPTLRLRGDYLAIVTLGFGEIVPIVLRNASGITNGAQGLPGVLTPCHFRLQLRLRFAAVLLPDPGPGRARRVRQLPPPVLAHGTGLAGAARRRARSRADGHQSRLLQAARLRHRRRHRAAWPAASTSPS